MSIGRQAGDVRVARILSAASTNATVAKGSPGQVYGWSLYNANAAVMFLKLYSKVAAPTVGTDTPVMTIALNPATSTNANLPEGVPFALGIGYALTTGVADGDTGAVAANEIVGSVFYR